MLGIEAFVLSCLVEELEEVEDGFFASWFTVGIGSHDGNWVVG